MRQDNRKLKRAVRASYVISTVSIALVLFLLGTLGYLIMNAVAISNNMKENVAVNVMLRNNISDSLRTVIGERLNENPMVRQATLLPKEQAAKEFKEYVGSDFEQFLGVNPLPDSYQVKMNSDASGRAYIEQLERQVMGWEGVDEVVYQKTVVEQIGANIRRFLLVLFLFGGTFFVIAVILLRNTIRAAIYSKRHIINTMKLVGATRWFILRPFVGESVLQGIYAALISTVMFLGMIAGLQEGLPEISMMLKNSQLAIIAGGMLVLGILISVIFTAFAVNKFINMKTSQIHLY